MKHKVWYFVFLLILISPFVLSIFFTDIEDQEKTELLLKSLFSISIRLILFLRNMNHILMIIFHLEILLLI